MMDAHVAALTALGMAAALAISTHQPRNLSLPDVVRSCPQSDIAAHNEASFYFTPAGQGLITADEE
jgi:hypothetical protein